MHKQAEALWNGRIYEKALDTLEPFDEDVFLNRNELTSNPYFGAKLIDLIYDLDESIVIQSAPITRDRLKEIISLAVLHTANIHPEFDRFDLY
jgi:hypothetical protein